MRRRITKKRESGDLQGEWCAGMLSADCIMHRCILGSFVPEVYGEIKYMSEIRKANCFRGDQWFDKKVHARVTVALEQKHQRFIQDNKNTPDYLLLEYVRQCAKVLGHTPGSGEVIGGDYIAARFGNWFCVIEAAGLHRPGKQPPLTKRFIYQQEYKLQAKQFKQEREEQKKAREKSKEIRAELVKEQQETRLEEDRFWTEKHRNDSDEQLLSYLRECTETLGHSPVSREVIGSGHIANRFICWPLALQLAELPLPKGMKPPSAKDINAYRRMVKQRTSMSVPKQEVE